MGEQQVTIVMDVIAKMDKAEAGFKKLQGTLQKLKLPDNLDNSFKKSFLNIEALFSRYKTQLEQGFETKGDVSSFLKTSKAIDSELNRLSKNFTELTGKEINFKVKSDEIKVAERALEKLAADKEKFGKDTLQLKVEGIKKDELSSVKNALQELQRITKGNTGKAAGNILEGLNTGNISQVKKGIDDLASSFRNVRSEAKLIDIKKTFGLDITDVVTKIITTLRGVEGEMDNFSQKTKVATDNLNQIKTNQFESASKAIGDAASECERLRGETQQATAAAQEYARATQSMTQQLGDLQQSTQYFFSLRNMINLLKRGIDDAIESVKELDKAMADTAVVTDYKISDLWGMLPDYTKIANELGATTQGAYETMTLYFQQGLDQQAAFEVGAETMKMARIAGLDYAETTDMMTAALRGFNMELNDVSAKRVNDVYSELAAITASDTEELGTAMQRTASIAHSAGASFEGTTAFLAQAIETTREPAENIGTAMKTIIARFQEMKKNPLEISEVEGEEVNYNKIDEALKTIGVDLKDANGQFREFDEVMLDISARWDGLSQSQQRYIATTAAGSRQQSRFIAMVSNYDRTMQLMEAANNSAGASDEQFGKTMESLEAKLNKLHNAWQQFTMGIANNSMIKTAVDGLTTFVSAINTVINTLSFGSGPLKSFLSIFTVLKGLSVGGQIVNRLINGIGGTLTPGSSFFKGFWGEQNISDMRGGQDSGQAIGLAGKITTPIVSKLSEVVAAIKNQKEPSQKDKNSTIANYKEAVKSLHSAGTDKPTTIKDISSIFNKLSDEHAYGAFKNAPGLTDAMRQASLGWLSSKNMPKDSQKIGQQLMNGIFKGMEKKEISIKEGTKLLGKPALWGEYFGTDVAKGFSKQYIDHIKQQVPDMRAKTQSAVQKTWSDLLGDRAENKTFQQGFLSSKEGKEKFITAYKANRQNMGLNDSALGANTVIQSNLQQTANKFGVFGSGVTAAGYSVQMFGTQLAQLHPALAGIGNLLSRIGVGFSTFGMGISGAGNVVTKVASRVAEANQAMNQVKAANALAKMGGVATDSIVGAGQSAGGAWISAFMKGINPVLLAAGIGAAVAGAIVAIHAHLEKKAKEAGEEVRKNFEDGFTKNEEKLNSISNYQDRFNELAKGVDEFGHNINLSTEEYDEYLNISKELSELSPSLIAGYNAEGQAILKKGKALDEVINKLKEEKRLALESYTTDSSIDKLMGEFKTSDTYKEYSQKGNNISGTYDIRRRAFDSELGALSKANTQAKLNFDIGDAIQQLGGGQVSSLSALSTEQILFVSQHYNDILNLIEEQNGQLDAEVKEGFKNAFGDISGAINDVQTEGAPIIEAMQRWMGSENLDIAGLKLGEEFSNGFTQGFNSIMVEGLSKGWDADQFKSSLREYSEEWKQLSGATSTYNEVLEDAEQLQEEYIDNIDNDDAIDNYKSNVEDLAIKLDNLAQRYRNTGAAGEAFAEQCVQQANALRNYATEGAVSLAEALNSLSDEFTSARGAQERFEEATKGGDYYTAAEQYKSIIETVLDDKNALGDGSLTGWAGADELLGQEYVDSHEWSDIVSQVEKLQGCFADGADGIIAFNDLLVENAEHLEGLGEVGENGFEFNLQTDDLAEYAKVLGMSEEALAALIDKARQWVPISLGNPKQIRQSLENSEYSMTGKSSKGENLVYTSEFQFREEARRQGIRGDDYTKTKNDVQEQGVRFLTVENLTTKNNKGLYADTVFENLGLKGADKNLDNAVSILTKMGFDIEDQKKILTADGLKLAEGKVTEDQVEEAYNEQEFATESPTIAGIADNTGTLVSIGNAMLASMGILTSEMKNQIATATNEENNQALIEASDQDYTTGDAYLQGTEQLRSQISDNNNTIELLKDGQDKVGANSARGQEIQAQIDLLEAANERLGQGLADIDNKWAEKLQEAQTNLQNVGKNQEEQGLIDNFAVDISSMMSTSNIASAMQSLTAFEDAANLSYTAIVNLAKEFVSLRQVDLGQLTGGEIDALLTSLGLAVKEAQELKAELQSPFRIETQLTGEPLLEYINNVEGLTKGVKTIALNTKLNAREKVTQIIDEINKTFGDGDVKQKTVIIEAASKFASGDKEGANKLLAEAFGGEAEEISQQLSILYDGSIANADELQASLEGELDSIAENAGNKTRETAIKVKANVTANFKNAKAKDQNAKVNYKRGNQVEAKDSEAGVNYNKIINQTPPNDGKAGVSYNYISYQEPPKDKTAYVTYKRSPNSDKGAYTGGFITTTGVLYRAKGGEAEWPGYPKKGTDRIPAYLSPGEYVQNRKAVDYFGIDFMRKINHQDLTGALQSFKSAAKGMNLSKTRPKENLGSQVTALVGEEGFEIGWIPSENRSVIFGAKGPEITAFPNDTVIYPHKQSQEILRQGKGKHKTLGSFGGGKDYIKSGGLLSLINSGGSSNSGGSVGGNNNVNTRTDQQREENAKEEEKILKKTGVVVVWWENQNRKVSVITRQVEKLLNGFNTLIKNGTLTLEQIQQTVGKDYVEKLHRQRDLNEKSFEKATGELDLLASKNGSKASKKSQKKVDNAQKKLNKAKTKAQKKKAKKELKKAKASLSGRDIENGGTWTKVSYEVTKSKKVKSGKDKGKVKKTKSSQNANVNLSKFIRYNDEGIPVIDQKQISKIAKKNKPKAKAIKEAAEAEINKRLQRQQEAEDNMIKAHEAEVDYNNQLEDAFHGWKNELTEVYRITNEIAKTEAKINIAKAKQSLAQAKIDALDLRFGEKGTGLGNLLKNVKSSFTEEKQLLAVRQQQEAQKLEATKSELQSALTLNALEQQYAANAAQAEQGIQIGSSTVYDALSEAEKDAYAKSLLLSKYLTPGENGGYGFNAALLANDVANGQLTGEIGTRLKDVFDTIANAENQILELEASQIQTEVDKLQLEQQEQDYYKQIADQLYGWENSLTRILELTRQIEQIEKDTSYLKKADEYYEAQRKAGFTVNSSTVIATFGGQLTSMINQMRNSSELLAEQRQDLQKYINGGTIQSRIDHLKGLDQTEATVAEIKNLEDDKKLFNLAKEFITTTTNADGTVSYSYDSENIEKYIGVKFDREGASKIEEYAQEIVEKNSSIQETMSNLLTQNTELYTMLAEAQQHVADSAKELREAYNAQQQKIIDNLKGLYSAIDNAFKELISQVKKSLQDRRQAEDNAKTESDISKKQQRLASLRANTAGGNQVEIAQLEQEIIDAQQAYGRTLEDQMIDKISQQGDEAAQQRQKQIDLLQAQRDIAYNTGKDAAIISSWIEDPKAHQNDIKAVLTAQENWSSLTEQERDVALATTNTKIAQLIDLVGEIPAVKEAIKNANSIQKENDSNISNVTTTAKQEEKDKKKREQEAKDKEAQRKKAEEDAKRKKAEAEAKAKAEAEAKRKAEEEAKRKAEEERRKSIRSAINDESASINTANAKYESATRKRMEGLGAGARIMSPNQYEIARAQTERDTAISQAKDKLLRIIIEDLKKMEASSTEGFAYQNSQLAKFLAENYGKTIPIGTKGVKAFIDKSGQLLWNDGTGNIKRYDTISGTIVKIPFNEQQFQKNAGLIEKNPNQVQFKPFTEPPKDYTVWLEALKIKNPNKYRNIHKYKTGGLASHTGPAWLDGTPSKPELVLNATDTKNFIALKDVLSRAMSSINSTSSNSYGDTTYEININVEKLTSDYDVDKVAERVKKIIVKDSSYRNVTQVRKFR